MKVRYLAAVGVAVAMAAAGCGGGGSNGSSDNTIKLVVADYGTGPSNSSAKYWKGVVSAFQKSNPKIKVNVQAIDWNSFDDKVKTMVQNKQYPDVMEGNWYADYVKEGLLYKADDVLSPATKSNLIPVFAKLGTVNGSQYAIPWTTSSRTLFYNTKIFKKAGISSAPKTWADVQNDAKKVKAAGKTGFGLPLGPEEAQAEALLWFLGNGGNFMSGSKWTINSPQNVATLTFMKNLYKSGVTEPNPGSKNRTDLWKQFAQGQIGMINGSPALIPIIQSGGKLGKSDWESVPIPGKTGPLSTTLGVSDMVTAFKNDGKKQADIKKFLDFAYNDTNQLKFDKEYDLLPATTSASTKMKTDPVFKPFFKALPNSVQYPTNNSAWPKVLTDVQHTLGTAMNGDPKKVLDQIQQTAQKAG